MDEDQKLYNEGIALLKEKRYEEAYEKLRAAATTGEDRPMEHYALGWVSWKRGDPAQAVTEFERFLRMETEENRYTEYIRDLLPRVRAEAEAQGKVAAEAAGSAAEAPAAEEAPEAEEAPVSSERVEAQAGSGEGSVQTEKSAGAEELFAEGVELLRKNRHDEAIARFEEFLRGSPGHPSALSNLGAAFLARGETGKALTVLEKARRAAPGDPHAACNLACAVYLEGCRKALEILEGIGEAGDDLPEVQVNLAFLRSRASRMEI